MSTTTPLRSITSKVFKYLRGTVLICCTYHCITEYFLDIAVCSGSSMEPTLHENDIVVVKRYFSDTSELQRGDILVVKNPSNPKKYWCKRLVGLPGDRVSRGFFPDVIPMGHIWLEGDNANDSHDSRIVGSVPQGLIQGKAICTLWPIMKTLNKPGYMAA